MVMLKAGAGTRLPLAMDLTGVARTALAAATGELQAFHLPAPLIYLSTRTSIAAR